MSELWCDYEARINWLQMYSMPPAMFPTDETEQRLKTHKRRKSQDDPLSPRSKRAARCPINPEHSDDSPVVMGFLDSCILKIVFEVSQSHAKI